MICLRELYGLVDVHQISAVSWKYEFMGCVPGDPLRSGGIADCRALEAGFCKHLSETCSRCLVLSEFQYKEYNFSQPIHELRFSEFKTVQFWRRRSLRWWFTRTSIKTRRQQNLCWTVFANFPPFKRRQAVWRARRRPVRRLPRTFSSTLTSSYAFAISWINITPWAEHPLFGRAVTDLWKADH